MTKLSPEEMEKQVAKMLEIVNKTPDYSGFKEYIKNNYLNQHPKYITVERLKQLRSNIKRWNIELLEDEEAKEIRAYFSEVIDSISSMIESKEAQKEMTNALAETNTSPQINFGLSDKQLGPLYDGLVNIGSLDDRTSKEDFMNIHLGRSSAGKITFLSGGNDSSVMPLIVEMYFQLGVFATVNKGLAGTTNISEDFLPFLQDHYTNSLTSLRNMAGQFKSGATQKAKAIIRLTNTIKNITN